MLSLALLPPGVAALGAPALEACGPSYQAVHEGDVRFEHCYRLDLDPGIGPQHRERCWRDWIERYTYGQTRDKVYYARRRADQISAGDAKRPTLAPGSEPAPVAPEAPIPTSLHAPPPPIVRPPPTNGPRPPRAECSDACGLAWRGCAADGGGADAAAEAGTICEADYAACVRRCFESQ